MFQQRNVVVFVVVPCDVDDDHDAGDFCHSNETNHRLEDDVGVAVVVVASLLVFYEFANSIMGD